METDEKLDKAIARHQEGDLDGAGAVYEAILKDDPENHRALSASAILAHQRGKSDEAIGLLERAIAAAPTEAGYHNNLGNIYRRKARPEKALECYRKAAALEPTNVETLCNVGSLCRRLSLNEDAREIFETVKKLAPDHPETNHNLALVYASLDMEKEALDCIEACHAEGVPRELVPTYHARVLTRFGRRDAAIALLERCLAARPDDPEISYELTAMKGELGARAPDDYVRKHFDGFAEGFDSQLASLDYSAPKLVGDLATTLIGEHKLRLILDLGCGTGLVGPYLRPLCEQLVGVDLSRGMLRFAEARKIYDDLVEMELTQALQEAPERAFDLATAADTLCYFGDLGGVFTGLARALRPGGAFIGTVEWHEGDEGPKILDSGRYSHSEAYVQATAESAGLAMRIAQIHDLRMEFGFPVKGLVFALENPAGH